MKNWIEKYNLRIICKYCWNDLYICANDTIYRGQNAILVYVFEVGCFCQCRVVFIFVVIRIQQMLINVMFLYYYDELNIMGSIGGIFLIWFCRQSSVLSMFMVFKLDHFVVIFVYNIYGYQHQTDWYTVGLAREPGFRSMWIVSGLTKSRLHLHGKLQTRGDTPILLHGDLWDTVSPF